MMNLQDAQRVRDWAPVPLRLIIGFGFAAHGWAKLSRGPEGFGEALAQIGIPLPHFMGWLTALVEFFGGLAVMAGAFVVLISLPVIVVNLVAMFTVHLPYGFKTIKLQGVLENGAGQFGQPGYELNLFYIGGMMTLALIGAGAMSVDQKLASWRGRHA